jgi:hypothetical protein
MPTDLVTIATTAALTQFVGPAFKHFGEQALERIRQVASKASSLLSTVGREPQPVEPKIIVPLAQAASLETDETLAEKWVALLANAADPVQRVAVQPGFAEVLRQLTLTDVAVLDLLYQRAPSTTPELLEYALPEVGMADFAMALGLTTSEFATSTDNLLRLRLCSHTAQLYTHSRNELPAALFRRLCPSAFGYKFMQAVTPPTP